MYPVFSFNKFYTGKILFVPEFNCIQLIPSFIGSQNFAVITAKTYPVEEFTKILNSKLL